MLRCKGEGIIVSGHYMVIGGFRPPIQQVGVSESDQFRYEPRDHEPLSTAVVEAVAAAHDEDVLDQRWLISDDINTDALDGLFQEQNLKMTLQFEADGATVTIVADKAGTPLITIQSHR